MSKEITFILEPDRGRITVESSRGSKKIENEIKSSLGERSVLNCGRPNLSDRSFDGENKKFLTADRAEVQKKDFIYLFRLYHYSTVDGPGRRTVVQFAGCSIRCPGCYVPETHRRENGKLTSIEEIVAEIDKKSGEHDGVTILGGEPFDQIEGLDSLVAELKEKDYHLTIYSGYTLEDLVSRRSSKIRQILSKTDLLIDGAYKRELAKNAGEYRGSSNQRLHFQPILEKYEQEKND